MPIPTPQSQAWAGDRALLLVHGVGNARPGSYDDLVSQIRLILGNDRDKVAIYVLYYDQVNEWFSAKVQAAQGFAALVSAIRASLDATKLGNVAADFAGDVIWPVLIPEGREAVRATILQQLRQIIADGERRGLSPRDQHLSVIAHSMGCFHLFEALHSAANDEGQGLTPSADRVRFDNVIFMASPIQLIRDVASRLGALVPQRNMLQCLAAPGLRMPSRRTVVGDDVPSVRRTVSITGNLDPVGGYLFRHAYAYMDLGRFDWTAKLPSNLPPPAPSQQVFVDQQHLLNITDRDELAAVLQKALQDLAPPEISLENPHAWNGYVERHAADLRSWLL